MHQPGVGRLPKQIPWLMAGLVLLAIVLRFWRLGEWNFQATEIFTLRDSSTPQFRNPRPLGYLLTYFLVRPIWPLDEFGLRLLPAVFGVLAIPVIFLVGRRLVGSRTGLFAALLLTFSPLHVMYSQLARYWSLVFLLCAIYPYAFYLGLRDRNRGALALALVAGVLAVLAHPVSLLLLGGPLLAIVITSMNPAAWRRLWSQASVRWGLLAAGLISIVVLLRFYPILHSWITQHDKHPGTGVFIVRPSPAGWKQLFYILAYVDSLTLPLVLLAALGIYVLWREAQRPLAIFLLSLALFPILFLSLLSLRSPVSQYYLLPTAPVFFLAAGVFLSRVSELEWRGYPRWLLPGFLSVIVIASGVPTLMSDYRDGRRYDFRRVARWLAPQMATDDVVFSDQSIVLEHYLPGVDVQRLRQPGPLAEAFQKQRRSGRGDLWIVAPAASHAFRASLKEGGLIDWIYANCQLRNTSGVGRMDYRQQYLQVYRCPPKPAADGATSQ